MKTDLSIAPIASEPRSFHFPEFERFHLANGLEILLLQQSDFPLINISLCIKSSALADPAGEEGTANFLSELLSEGTTNRTSSRIAEELEFIAANFSAYTDWHAIHMEMNALSQHLDKAFEIFSDMLLQPVFPEAELKRIKRELLTERIRVVDNPARLNAEQFIRSLYPKVRYGMPVEGGEKTIKKIERSGIVDFYDEYFTPANATLIFAGDIDRETAKKISQKYLSSWKSKSKPMYSKPQVSQPDKTVIHLTHKPGSAQTELRMGHLGIERKNPDYYAVTLLNEILGGYFLSRINMNLREEHGYTYGANSSFSYRPGLGPFHVTASIQSEHTAAAVQEVIKEISTIRQELVKEEELKNARGQIVGLFPIAFETTAQVAMGLSNIILAELPDDYYNTFRNRISQVTRENILQAAQKYLHPEKLQIALTGDRDIIEQDLRKHFDVRVYDVKGNSID